MSLLLVSCDIGRNPPEILNVDDKLFLKSFMSRPPQVKIQSVIVYTPVSTGWLTEKDMEKSAKRVWHLNEEQSVVLQSRFRSVSGVAPEIIRRGEGDVYRLVITYSGGGMATVLAKDSRKGKTEMSLVGVEYYVNDSISEFLSGIEYREGGAAKK